MRKTTKMAVVLAAMSVMVLGAATMVSADEKQGWVKDGSDWYYYNEDEKLVNGWAQDGEGLWYFLGEEGKMLKSKFVNGTDRVLDTDHDNVDVAYYYVDDKGVMVTGWKKVTAVTDEGKPYEDEDSKGWYYFGTDGKMYQESWIKGATAWYAVGTDGKMITRDIVKGDIATDSGKNYFVNGDGAMITGWYKATDKDTNLGVDENAWVYAKDSGELVKEGWQKVSGTWYFFGGVSQSALNSNNEFDASVIDGNDYQMVSNAMFTVDSELFFVNSNGAMATGWKSFTTKELVKADRTTTNYLFGSDGILERGEVDLEVKKVNVGGAKVYVAFATDGTAYKTGYAENLGDDTYKFVGKLTDVTSGAKYHKLGSAAAEATKK